MQSTPAVEYAERYEVLELLGEGGMGSVLRVRDRELNRTVAMKILKAKLLASDRALARFKEEAQIAAQLQHPGIIPVHDIGRRTDGSVYFTMKEVKGKTFEDVIDEMQVALEDGHHSSADGWTFRRVIDAFHRVCETLAYAHHRGVAHRDLKPENVMVGAFGEVLVLDWGLAKILAEEYDASDEGIVTSRSMNESVKTRMGSIAGTPSYMAPEQARGQIHKITPATDVYGLGGILYAILAGRTPYMERKVRDVLDKVAEGHPIVPPLDVEETPGPVPPELSEIAMKALSFRAGDRYPDGGAMGAAIAAWLDGARKREKALEIVAEAEAKGARVPGLLSSAGRLEAESAAMLEALGEGELEQRYPAWELEAQARAQRDEAERLELEVLQGLRAALTHAPDLPEAHDRLAERFHAAHQQAERDGDRALAQQMELELQAHDLRGTYARYLRGDGAVTLVSDPPGAAVALYEYVEQHKRLVPMFRRDLGVTPIVEQKLPQGRWMLKITHPGHHAVIYPVTIERLQHWDGVPPNEREPFPIVLPKLGELADDDCYIPAGWFWSGGPDGSLKNPLPKRWLWCPALVFKKYPVTIGDLMDVCERLWLAGDAETPEVIVPRYEEQAVFAFREGRVQPVPTADNELFLREYLAMFINFEGVLAYIDAVATETGVPWRLPHELEWVKAARGVDRRKYSWGFSDEERFAQVLQDQVPSVNASPLDVSPFGVWGVVGGVQDWMADASPAGTAPQARRVVEVGVANTTYLIARGGSWAEALHASRLAQRKRQPRNARDSRAGFRLCRSFLTPGEKY